MRNDIEIPQDRQVITFEGLSAILADFLLNNPKFSDPNFEQALSDVLAIIPTLQHGMDINLHFEYAKEFEFTGATTVFDICNIDLLHGWVCDPRDQDVYHVVAKELKSYNAVVEAIIAGDVALTSSEHTSDSDIAIAKGSFTLIRVCL